MAIPPDMLDLSASSHVKTTFDDQVEIIRERIKGDRHRLIVLIIVFASCDSKLIRSTAYT